MLQAAASPQAWRGCRSNCLKDPQLHARGFIQEVDRAFIGKHPQPSLPFRETEKPFPIRSAPPTLGEHNREILGGCWGCRTPSSSNWHATASSEPRC